ncbi:MAG: cytochrome P450 [Steroidobacteraceae bacterium]
MTSDQLLPPESDQRFDIGSTADSLDRMRGIYAQLGDAYRVYAPGRQSHTWVFNHPDDVRRILIANHRNYAKGVGFDRIKILLGNGIIVSEGEFWKRQRRMMQPTFHRRILGQFDRMIATANDRLLGAWQDKCARGEPVNVTDDMSGMTLEIVLGAIFGDDLAAMASAGDNPFAVLTDEPARDLRFAYRFRKLAAMISQCVAQRRAAGSEPAGDHPDYVSMLLNARDKETGEGMTDKEIVDEITTLIVAGHETTASALNWTWYLLGEHPEVEAKLHAEIDANEELGVPSLQAMEALPYSNMVIREAMRLYPPVWVVSRRTIEADTLAGFTVPAGTDVFFSPYFVHRHPDFWSDAEKFVPERFARSDEDERPKLTYLPFSAGAHHCIGETLALYEMLVHLNRFARRFRLRRVDNDPVEFEALINLRATRPFLMRLEPRQNS